MPLNYVNLTKLRITTLILICFALTPYSNGVASQNPVPIESACACCTGTNNCGETSKCNPSSPSSASSSSEESCPCPPRCYTNMGTGTPSICLEARAFQTKISPFVLSRIASSNEKYESLSYKPPTPPPKKAILQNSGL